jgi:signal transduction histidine kinase
MENNNSSSKISVVKVVSPILLVLILFLAGHFLLLMPYVKQSFSIRKLESMREVSKVVFIQLNEINKAIEAGVVDGEEAKKRATEYLSNLRYGNNNKDYFWGYDTSGTFLFHGYMDELLTTDAFELQDPFGKDIVKEVEEKLKSSNSATVEYYWYYHEDESVIIPKITYVVKFEP